MTIVWILSYLALYLLGLQTRELVDRYLDWRAQRKLEKSAAEYRAQIVDEARTPAEPIDYVGTQGS